MEGRWKVDGLYVNLDPGEPRGFSEVWKWRRERAAAGWRPTGLPPPGIAPDLARLRDPPGPQATWVGHATWLVQLDGKTILTDPIWGGAGLGWRRFEVPRAAPPGVPFDALPPVDLVLVSHNHYDHLDARTIRRFPRSTPIACPEGLGGWFRRRGFREVHELSWWEETRAAGFGITAVPAQHWSRRGLFDIRRSHWCGFVVEGETKIYFAGDSAYFSGFRAIGDRFAPDVSILPIGAYEPRWFMRNVHMDPDEAMLAFRELKSRAFLPMHWGTFRLTDEPLDEPPARLRALWAAVEKPASNLGLATFGETVRL